MEPINVGSDERPVSLTEMHSTADRSVPPTWVRLCGHLGWLYGVGQDAGGETACFMWQTDRRYSLPGTSPLLLACMVAGLYDRRQLVRLPKFGSVPVLEIIWLEVGCDDTLSVVLRPRSGG